MLVLIMSGEHIALHDLKTELLAAAKNLDQILSNIYSGTAADKTYLDKDRKQELCEAVTDLWNNYLQLTDNTYQTDFISSLFNAKNLEKNDLNILIANISSLITKKRADLLPIQKMYTTTKHKDDKAKLERHITSLSKHIKSLNASLRQLKKMRTSLSKSKRKYMKNSATTLTFMVAGGLVGAIGQTLSAPFRGVEQFFSIMFGSTDNRYIHASYLNNDLVRLIVASVAMPIEVLRSLFDPTAAISNAEFGRILADPFYNSLGSIKKLISLLENPLAENIKDNSSMLKMSDFELQLLELYLIAGNKVPTICQELINTSTTDAAFTKISEMSLEANLNIILQIISLTSSSEDQFSRASSIQLVKDLLQHTISTKLDDSHQLNTYKALIKAITWVQTKEPAQPDDLLTENLTTCKIYEKLSTLKEKTKLLEFKLELSEIYTMVHNSYNQNHITIIINNLQKLEEHLQAANKYEWLAYLQKFRQEKPELNQIISVHQQTRP